MSEKPYLLLDAGGTMLFPNPYALRDVARRLGHEVEPLRFYESHYRCVHVFDSLIRGGNHPGDISLTQFYQMLLRQTGVPEALALQAGPLLAARDAEKSLWSFTFDWVRETLETLAGQGYRMTVISNSDGRVRRQLFDVGLGEYFESIYDSAEVGVEKPDPRIFQHVLDELNLQPERAVYVGDIYAIDVIGANSAGIGAVHLDPFGLYTQWPGEHVADLRELTHWLARLEAGRDALELYPKGN